MTSAVISLRSAARAGLIAGAVSAAIALSIVFFDRPLAMWLSVADGSLIQFFFQAVTVFGSARWYLLSTALLVPVFFLWARRASTRPHAARLRWLAWALIFVFLAVALSQGLNELIKILCGRPRPPLVEEVGFFAWTPFTRAPGFDSFPSGHANAAMAIALALGFIAPRLRWALLALAAAVALSRLVLNVHYLSDVVAGAALAAATSYWLRECFASRRLVFVRKAGGRIQARLARTAGRRG